MQRRTATPVALAEVTELLASVQQMPEGFTSADLFTSAPAGHHKFSDMMMMATGVYIMISGASSFIPRIASKLMGTEAQDAAARLSKWLAQCPESSFGWHMADLRTPLPSLEVLGRHPIGYMSGRKVYLCDEQATLEFLSVRKGEAPILPTIEVSPDFTKHYGTRVYIVYEN